MLSVNGDADFSPEEQQSAKAIAQGIAKLGLTEEQFAAAFDAALNREVDPAGLHDRLAALPDKPTAQQTAQAAFPDDGAAQAALLPVLANEEARASALVLLAGSTAEKAPRVAFGWWDKTKFIVKCSAAIAAVLISFAPAGSSIKVVRAVALFRGTGRRRPPASSGVSSTARGSARPSARQ
ncbi:hypothetical protein [Streptomyces sp. NBC_00829]|uniref:hypothetical protein n=1 Tax=Streptomyces sp. NBC_00829 TaxID=2903679 RepID=UPI00386B50A1|nr:hypothetical protein OG293_04015 [Streptomyces sp. NBC_00829]